MDGIEEFSAKWIRCALPYRQYQLEVFFAYNFDPKLINGKNIIIYDQPKEQWWFLEKVEVLNFDDDARRLWCHFDCIRRSLFLDKPSNDDILKELI